MSGISHEIEGESVVDDVFFSRDADQVELVLAYSVPDLMESHVDRLATFHLYVVVR